MSIFEHISLTDAAAIVVFGGLGLAALTMILWEAWRDRE